MLTHSVPFLITVTFPLHQYSHELWVRI
ncbi:hypothetical protein F383_27014 [Gossypium arboreum]|uniref:Uncharacterized protein n=1 Tax=Gossypium arboreum TaxID=29729 RepID=A0A0B0P6U9_GOSAR|nr:hypothetical protein F383_27014 [Gossypium arboreum]